MGWFSILCLLIFVLNTIPSPATPLCHPPESSALLRFKSSFSNTSDFLCSSRFGIDVFHNSTLFWNSSSDCCEWSGVTCHPKTSHVIGIHLYCGGLRGIIDSNNSLFSLNHLQTLDLSGNDFQGSTISPRFGRFKSMFHLDLGFSSFSGHLPIELGYLTNLLRLDLSYNDDLKLDTSILKRLVANLTSLNELRFSSVDMSNVLTDSFVNLSTTLTNLDLSACRLKWEFPESIFRLPNLQVLDLGYNPNLTGSYPEHNWTSPLRDLTISRTGLLTDLLYVTQNLKHLNTLYATDCNFVGSFPTLLGNLKQIAELGISNNNFGGEFPWDSLNLEKLTILDLSDNNFVGQLPEICSNNTKTSSCLHDSSKHHLLSPLPLNLQSLILSNNSLNGTLPSWLFSLPSLVYLNLANNQFSGHINEFQFNSLEFLNLKSNKFQGLIPGSIFQQANLSYLILSSNHLTAALMFEDLSNLKHLTHLSLSSCNISEFPYSIRSLENLKYLDLSNNRIEGIVPHWFSSVGKYSLSSLNLSHNLLTRMDSIPWKTMGIIDLKFNRLEGNLPIPPPSISVFSFSNNKLGGEISSGVCSLNSVVVFDLSNNNMSGFIPSCIGNSSRSLSVLDLRMNKFRGTIPLTFAKGNSLRTINLNGNELEGSLPRSLVNCKRLEVIDIGNNKMSGSFPFWLDSLPELQVLVLRSNRFYGSISKPRVRFPFQKLRIMDISHNEFIGVLPMKYFENFAAMRTAHVGEFKYMQGYNYYDDSVMVVMKGFYYALVKIQIMFVTIDLASNNFSGEIPELIGNLHALKGLNFSHNKLTGVIPSSLGDLRNLEWLDLSSNELVGKIPWQIAANLDQLQNLNLSSNKLEGPIPRSRHFDTFNNDSFGENSGLCGFPLSKSCHELPEEEEEDEDEEDEDENNMFNRRAVMMGYASGLVIGISVAYIVFSSRSFDYYFMKKFGGRLIRQ